LGDVLCPGELNARLKLANRHGREVQVSVVRLTQPGEHGAV
jgi:hypothetical protein